MAVFFSSPTVDTCPYSITPYNVTQTDPSDSKKILRNVPNVLIHNSGLPRRKCRWKTFFISYFVLHFYWLRLLFPQSTHVQIKLHPIMVRRRTLQIRINTSRTPRSHSPVTRAWLWSGHPTSDVRTTQRREAWCGPDQQAITHALVRVISVSWSQRFSLRRRDSSVVEQWSRKREDSGSRPIRCPLIKH